MLGFPGGRGNPKIEGGAIQEGCVKRRMSDYMTCPHCGVRDHHDNFAAIIVIDDDGGEEMIDVCYLCEAEHEAIADETHDETHDETKQSTPENSTH